VGYEVAPFYKNWESTFYVLEQIADGIIDRQEVRAEIRYRAPGTSFFSLLDYSTEFSTINYFMSVLNLTLDNKSSLDIIADYRKTPFLTSTSALQGQRGVSSLGDLLEILTEEEIEQLSIDRTSMYKSFSMLYGYPLNDELRVTADLSVSNLSGTIASGGVEAIEGTGTEYSYSAGMIANSLLVKNDINILNLRFSDLSSSDAAVVSLSSKYRLNSYWRINPRIKYDARDYNDGREIDKFKPSLRLHYRKNKNWEFEFDFEYEAKSTKVPSQGTEDETSYILHAGYIYIF